MSTKKITDNVKFDEELTALSVAYFEAIQDGCRCPECRQMRYMSQGFFCMNEECQIYKRETGKL